MTRGNAVALKGPSAAGRFCAFVECLSVIESVPIKCFATNRQGLAANALGIQGFTAWVQTTQFRSLACYKTPRWKANPFRNDRLFSLS